MKRENRIQIDIGDCRVHYRRAPRGWAIIVMPDKLKWIIIIMVFMYIQIERLYQLKTRI
ncbi:MAG: hypothetical protein A4E26_01432 [Methanobacterium sp. PtaU1.Bin097]|nr:MAG: hypothetical protein A4E26_01432 [Methanobacterium sp. PtaU1.Bin097]